MSQDVAQLNAKSALSSVSHRQAHWLLALTALFLAGNHIIGRSVHGVVPPLGLSFWRWFFGVLILALFILPRFRAVMAVYRAHLPTYLLLGSLMVGSTSIIMVALSFTTAINVSLINAVQPTLTVLLAVVFLKDRVTRGAIVGVCSALFGVVFMLSKGSWTTLAGLEFNGGDLVGIAAMFGFSAYALNLKKLPRSLSVAESLFGISLMGTLVLAPFYILESIFYKPVPMDLTTASAALALALLVSVFGNLMWNRGNQVVGPSRAAIFINLIPVFGALLAVTFLDEEVFSYHLVGAAFVCLGIWLVVGRQQRKRRV